MALHLHKHLPYIDKPQLLLAWSKMLVEQRWCVGINRLSHTSRGLSREVPRLAVGCGDVGETGQSGTQLESAATKMIGELWQLKGASVGIKRGRC